MINFTVKGIPEALYEALKARAETNRRSINSELIVCLEEALAGRRLNPERLLARVDELRNRVAQHAAAAPYQNPRTDTG